MPKPLIVVTGVSGQLGWSIKSISHLHQEYDFLFVDKLQLDLSNPNTIEDFFKLYQPKYFINCAAYTAVDKAESEQITALTINATSVGEIAKQCAAINATLILISTDYVFDGNGKEPYKPYDATDPVNYYGYTKWLGEKLALENNPNTIIIRTSWVYAEHGNNFVKTMLRLMKERNELKVVNDQIGTPTYATDLANGIMNIVIELNKGNTNKGIYHFSNSGVISWFQFAEAIKELSLSNCTILPIASSAYPTPAKRPAYSVLNKESIQTDFNIQLIDWKKSLQICINELAKV